MSASKSNCVPKRRVLVVVRNIPKNQARAFLATRKERFYLKMCTFEASGSQERIKRVAQLQNVWACRQFWYRMRDNL